MCHSSMAVSTKSLLSGRFEFKEEDRDRLGPKLYRRRLHVQPKIIVKTKPGTKCVEVHIGQQHPMPQRPWSWRTS